MRFVIIIAVVCVLCRWISGKWPWQFLTAQSTRQQAIFKARKLLAVRADASYEEIMAAHKRLIAMVHPDKGGTNDQVHEANAARDLLLDEIPDRN
ncbi:J domain-containing protein [Altererythrobacter lutimaris]|uniref:J domain-containing protein n=1 Tax=Altererythrobacter lutimaris TaxID=2743979 RepID=A0A850HIL4_9SPHN|nr:J domain-containing protein [Altererythrobacter lutimaris]NVE95502.1 J domain-containing protein [Altererythrobacter lutimaris]